MSPLFPEGSKPFSLSALDWKKIGKGAAFSVVGALVGYCTATLVPTLQEHTTNDVGAMITAIIAAILPIILNTATKWLSDTRQLVIGFIALTLALSGNGTASAEPVAPRHLFAQSQDVLPTPGRLLGLVQSDTAGKWIVLSSDLMPVQPVVREEGKLCFFEGPAGRYAVIQILAGDGQPVVSTVILGSVTPPGPDPVPDPPSPVLTQRSIAVRDAANKATADANRADTATKLATLYGEVARKVRAGEIKGADSIAFVAKTGADMLISGNTATWQPFREVLSNQFAALLQEGGKDADYAKLLDEVSAGLMSSVPRDKFAALDLKQMLELIRMIIDMILKMLPANAAGPVKGVSLHQ